MCKEWAGCHTQYANHGVSVEKQELRTMRKGKTKRDLETGAHATHLQNKAARAEAHRQRDHTSGKKAK